MKIKGKHYRSVWESDEGKSIEILDQTALPYELNIVKINTMQQAAAAIKNMLVRGAPLIGAVGAYGFALAMQEACQDKDLDIAYEQLIKTRPTAVNLKWSLDRLYHSIKPLPTTQRAQAAWLLSRQICEEDIAINQAIAQHGLTIIEQIAEKKIGPVVNILTHCNAGWLATVDWGTALAPIYAAHDAGIPVHVWVDETRPRNQGLLTAFELASHGVPHTLIADNAGGHLMQHHRVDLCIVGTDRTSARGDVCNKIGTYLKALAAYDNHIPFYVGLPSPSIDWSLWNGIEEIEIEKRDPKEQSHVQGINDENQRCWVNTVPKETQCANFAFDVTPAKYITGLITERGVCSATAASLRTLFPEHAEQSLLLEQNSTLTIKKPS